MNSESLQAYQANEYLRLCGQLVEELGRVRDFVSVIIQHKSYSSIPGLVDLYQEIFDKLSFGEEIEFEIQRMYKLHYFRNPGKMDRNNSYYHIKLKLRSPILMELDELYENNLSGLLKLFKHFFTKLDNLYSEYKPEKAQKFLDISEEVESEMKRFIDSSEKRSILDQRKKLQEVHLSQLPFGGLFYIAPVVNLKGILEGGILSHNKAHTSKVVMSDISNQQVNERRKRAIELTGRSIHDYAPLYINPKNPMLFYLCKNGHREQIVLIHVLPHLLLSDQVLFSDGNAASKSTKFYRNIEEFNRLPWKCINDEVWSKYVDGTRFRCSEVLVPDCIPTPYLLEIICPSESVLKQVIPLFPNHYGIKVRVDRTMFF